MEERKHLVAIEIGRLITAAKGSRNAARDHCLMLLMFRHGLRVSEACGLRLSQVDIESRVLHVARLKKGLSTSHPLIANRTYAVWGLPFYNEEQRDKEFKEGFDELLVP
jgi:type 1 fimbriae regulatory protein FimB